MVKRGLPLYVMILPGFLYFLFFRYAPMGGLIIVFKEYDPIRGFLRSAWVGLEQFRKLFSEQDLSRLFVNTIILSLLNLFLFFPAPIILALLLNEVKQKWYKKTVQTIVYMPHFISWIVVVSITVLLVGTQDGALNRWLVINGMERVEIMTRAVYFRPLYVFQNIWKETGWSAIIFIATLATVDPSLYEASVVDGANRIQKILHINLPALKSTVIILFILRLGSVLDTGFEHIYLLQNPLNLRVSDVFDTYIFRMGIRTGQFSYSTAIGMFKSIVSLLLVLGADRLAKKVGEEGVY
jgi:putative aldouronate transport system permease protein